MSSDLPPANPSRPKSAPSSERNQTRDRNTTNVCDEAAQTESPLTIPSVDAATSTDPVSVPPAPPVSTNTTFKPDSSNLFSDDTIHVRSNLVDSITAPIMKQNQQQQSLLESLDNTLNMINNRMSGDSSRLHAQLSSDLSQLKSTLSTSNLTAKHTSYCEEQGRK